MINTHRKLYKLLFIFSLAFFSFFTSLFVAQVADAFGGPITSPFSKARYHPTLHIVRGHDGMDIGVPIGTPIPALRDGTVSLQPYDDGGYGNYMIINLDDGNAILYAHLSKFIATNGQRVKKGQIVGLSGMTGGISDGPHLHAEYHPGGYRNPQSPYDYYIKNGWDLSGNTTSGPEDGGGWLGEIKKAISVDFNYTTYFNPSEALMELVQKIIGLIKATFVHLQESLLPLLIALITIELAWTMIKASLDGSFSAMMIIPAIIRYGFFITIAKSWDYIIDHVFVRFFEQMSETVTGSTKSVESFLNFDAIYKAVQKVMEHNMHPSVVFFDVWNYIPFLLQNILIWTILFLILGLMIWVMYKFVAFYLICAFGIIGIPLHFVPTISAKGKSMLGVVISSTLDLLLVSFLINIMVAQINSLPVIEADSLVGLTMFIITLFLLSIFVGKLSNNCSSMLSHAL